jgi:hypothetical protein
MTLLFVAGLRDWVIILAGIMMILTFFALFVFTVVLGLSIRALLGVVRSMLKEEVNPLLDTTRLTVQRVQGTATFLGESAASPVIRVYGVVAGARRAAGVIAGINGRRNPKGEDHG